MVDAASILTLIASAFDGINKDSDLDAIERCLTQFGDLFRRAQPTRRNLALSEAKRRLKELGLQDAVKALEVALGQRTILFAPEDPVDYPFEDADILFDIVYDRVRMYVVVTAQQAVAITLWIVHSYCCPALSLSPILWISSPVKRCGKTTLVMVVGALAHHVVYTSNITPAALFRVMDEHEPTLLIDEADTKFGKGNTNEELRSILNAGHTRTLAKVIRAVPSADGAFETREFSVFGPKVVAGIGRLPDTIQDRSIHIALGRKTQFDQVKRLRADRITKDEELTRSLLARWSEDHRDELRDAEPLLPEVLNDRACDNWRPLIGIADLAGGSWPARARAAALALSPDDTSDDVSVLILADLKYLFAETDASFLRTKDILDALHARDDRPWPEWKNGLPMTDVQLARLLRSFEARSTEHRDGKQVVRGYLRAHLKDAFTRYLPG